MYVLLPIILKTMAAEQLLGLLGMGVNAGLGAINNSISQYYTRQNMLYGYQLNEKAAQEADRRTRRLYHDFYSPGAQMRQIEEAGLSPSIYFGGTPGQGGMSGAQGGTNAMAGAYAPMSLMEGAQIANIMAQTQKTKEETKTVQQTREAEVAKLWADAGYAEAAAALTKAQKTGQEWQNYITGESADFNINQARALAEKAANDALKGTYEIIKAQVEAGVSEATYQAQVEAALKNVELLNAEILLKKSQKGLNEQKIRESAAIINKWQEEVKQGWKDVATRMYNARTDRERTHIYEEEVMRSMNVLEKRLGYESDWKDREFLWTIVDGTFDNFTNAFNSAANPGNITHQITH